MGVTAAVTLGLRVPVPVIVLAAVPELVPDMAAVLLGVRELVAVIAGVLLWLAPLGRAVAAELKDPVEDLLLLTVALSLPVEVELAVKLSDAGIPLLRAVSLALAVSLAVYPPLAEAVAVAVAKLT